jgi:hypothetical protein
MGGTSTFQKLVNFYQITRRHMPDNTRLNFIIAAGMASRLTNELCVVTNVT